MRDFGELLNSKILKGTTNYKEERPWGSFEHLLEEGYCKVKRIVVKPNQRLSYQYHHKRSECWVVVQGEAVVTLNDKVSTYKTQEVVQIPVGMKHRVENKGKEDLIFIETQTGTYFGEDDIVRLDDDYDRIKKKGSTKKVKKEKNVKETEVYEEK